jgi:LacI family transcriptional regulator
MKSPQFRNRVTLRDIAQAVGLSHGAVSLALRDSSEIAAATRQRVQAAAREMGYQPNAMATSLARFRWNAKAKPVQSVIAWINCWPEPKTLRRHREFDAYWRGAKTCAQKFGYRLEEFIANGKLMSLARLEKVLLARGIRGILLPPHRDVPDWGSFPWEKFSLVRFGRSLPTPRVHLVTANQAGDAIMAIDQLEARGYERIGWVRSRELANRRNRTILFEGGFFAAQMEMEKEHVVPILKLDPAMPHTHHAELKNWIKREKPDAILTDHPMLGKMLKACGYRVPEDIGLAGTTVLDTDATAGIDQHPEEIGRVGMLVLLSQINDDAKGIPPIFRQILVEGEWIDGPSLPPRR